MVYTIYFRMEKDINSTSVISLDDATMGIIRQLIETKFGAKVARCCKAKDLRVAVFNSTHQYISEASIKRFFGLVAHEGGRFRKSTIDLLAVYLGYESFAELHVKIKDQAIDAPMQTLDTVNLERGSQIKLSFAMGLESLMCYIGDNNFIINRSTMPWFAKGDIYNVDQISTGKSLSSSTNGLLDGKPICSILVTSIRIVL